MNFKNIVCTYIHNCFCGWLIDKFIVLIGAEKTFVYCGSNETIN